MILTKNQFSARIRYESTWMDYGTYTNPKEMRIQTESYFDVELTVTFGELGMNYNTHVPGHLEDTSDILDAAYRNLLRNQLTQEKVIYTNWYTRQDDNIIRIATLL